MRLAVPKKALLALGGAAASSVGTWKLYEEVDPSVGTILQREGFHYRPIEADLKAEGLLDVSESSEVGKRFNFVKGPSIKRLLPNFEDVTDTLESNSNNHQFTLEESFYKGFEASSASFLADIKHWPPDSKQNNGGLIVKLELVIKNKVGNKAFVVQNVISNLIKLSTRFSNRFRFFTVEKESNNWKIKNGFGAPDHWILGGGLNTTTKFLFTGFPGLNLEIDIGRFCTKEANKASCPDFKQKTPISYRYSGIWQPYESSNQSLFEPIQAISKGTDNEKGSLWGLQKATDKLTPDYIYKDHKWSSLTHSNSIPTEAKKLFDALMEEKNRKGKWIPLEDFCSSWSRGRKNKDFKWKEFCYSKESN